MDKLIDALAGSGPWGILCAILLAIIVALGMFVSKLLEMYVESQTARIDDGLKMQEVVNRQGEIFQSLRDTILSQRRSR